jgi:transcriptional regulator
VQDPERLLALVTRLTDAQEGGRERPWKVSDAPEEYVKAQLRGITGFELTIARLEGKWKLSQNRPPGDHAAVAAALFREGGEAAAAVARLMVAAGGD